MRTYELFSKEAYLKWVAEWKEEYQRITFDIRNSKEVLAQPHIVTLVYESPYGNVYSSNMAGTQSLKASLRAQARKLLQQRQEGKELSWQLKLKNNSTV